MNLLTIKPVVNDYAQLEQQFNRLEVIDYLKLDRKFYDEGNNIKLTRKVNIPKTVYPNTVLEWQCDKSHCWLDTLENVDTYNTWCVYCDAAQVVDFSRTVLEKLSKQSFTRDNPEWMKGTYLDGFNSKMNVAFEYRGKITYNHVAYMHDKTLDFEQCKELHMVKRTLCRDKGVYLIDIPETFTMRDKDKLIKVLASEYTFFVLTKRIPGHINNLKIIKFIRNNVQYYCGRCKREGMCVTGEFIKNSHIHLSCVLGTCIDFEP